MEISRLDGVVRAYEQTAVKRQEAGETGTEAQASQTTQAGTPPTRTTPVSGADQGGDAAAQNQVATTQTDESQTVAAMAAATTDSEEDDASYQAIVTKADSGQALTQSEMATLRAKDPARYSRAMQAQVARQNLREEMERHPSDANRVLRESISALQAGGEGAAKVHGALPSGDTQTMVRAMNDEYTAFSRQYDQVVIELPYDE